MNAIQRSLLLSILSLFVFTSLTLSCKKKPKGSFVLRGKFMDSCGGTAMLPNMNIVVAYRETDSTKYRNKKRDSIGVGKTDAQGNFNLICQDWGEGNLEVYVPTKVSATAYHFAQSFPVDEGQKQTIDLGEIFAFSVYKAEVNLKIKGFIKPEDTLYIDGVGYPNLSSGIIKVYSEYRAGLVPVRTYIKEHGIVRPMYWGIGKNGYDSVVKNQNSMNRLNVKFTHCGFPTELSDGDIQL